MMGKWFVFLCVLTLGLSSTLVTSLTYCHRGSYYLLPKRGTFVCDLCPPGTFMPFHDHKETECLDCMEVEDDTLEILITPCNRTHNTVIHCIPGYYRRLPMNSREKERCEKCGECGIFSEILPCRTYEDVHCCAVANYDVLPNKDGILVCVERPWLCRQGEYFDTSSFQCFPCPDDTCMPLDYHSMTECLKCHSSSRDSLPKHGTIIQPCNKTHQAVVGCGDGYFINRNMGGHNKDIGCSPCKNCSSAVGLYEGRKCGRAQDTVCCPQPNMTVVDTQGDPKCIPFITETLLVQNMSTPETTVCGKDNYLYIEDKEETTTVLTNNKRLITCKPCPRGTYMDEDRHNSTSCKNCKQFTGDSRPQSCPLVVSQGESHKDYWMVGLMVGCITGALLLLAVLAVRYAPPIYIDRLLFFCRWRRGPLSNLDKEKPAKEPLIPPMPQNTRGGHEICSSTDHPQRREEKCKHRGRHQEYITMADFTKNHLPTCWYFLEDYIKVVADLTVKLSVTKISEKRPSGYPLYEHKGKHGMTAYGSGLIMHAKWFTVNSARVCPCGCDKPWGEVEVFCANHVVFDDDESRHTICEIGYDAEENRDSCPRLKVVGQRYNNVEIDHCILRCITHEKRLTDDLDKNCQSFRSLKGSKTDNEDQELVAVIISHPHGMSKRISVGKLLRREEVAPYKYIYETLACEGSGGAPVCILAEGVVALHGGENEWGENQSNGTALF